jgi:hypothetical protein
VIGRWLYGLSDAGKATVAMGVTTLFFWAWLVGLVYFPWVMIPLTVIVVGLTAIGVPAVIVYVARFWFIDYFADIRQQVILNEMTGRYPR